MADTDPSAAWLFLSVLSTYTPLIALTINPSLSLSLLALVWLGSILVMMLSLYLWLRSLRDEDSGMDQLQNLFSAMAVFLWLALALFCISPIWSSIVVHKRGLNWLPSILLGLVLTLGMNASWYISLLLSSRLV